MEGSKLRNFDPEYVISCLPTIDTITVIQEVLQFTKPKHLIVDTPISTIYKQLTELRELSSISVLEDNHLVYFANQLEISKSKPRVIFVKNALYDYHGVALLSKTFGTLSKGYFKIRIRNFLLLIFKAGNRLIIWIGPRNYSTGMIYFIKPKLFKRFYQKYEFRNDLISDWTKNYMLENLNSSAITAILNSNPIRFMYFWKRMALGECLEKFIFDDVNFFLSLEEALENERYFRKIGWMSTC
jgi:hypothetical protein